MKFFCIGDADTVRAFRLAGIAGQVVRTPPEAAAALSSATARADCAIIILTARAAREIRGQVDTLRLERAQPLILEIPGPEGPLPGGKSLPQLVEQAIGIRVGQGEGT